jgi:hypothetical protein
MLAPLFSAAGRIEKWKRMQKPNEMEVRQLLIGRDRKYPFIYPFLSNNRQLSTYNWISLDILLDKWEMGTPSAKASSFVNRHR